MIFTSYTYLLFLAGAFFVHWLLPTEWRKPFLIFASYVFYCTWQWRFGLLLLSLSLFNWLYGRWAIPAARSQYRLVAGILVNLSVLLYFKYTTFIVANVASLVNISGSSWHPRIAEIILPLGLSFFTFQGIAYLFDVAAGEAPIRKLGDFLLFKALWPQLIAGPIIRLEEMRAQLATPRTIAYDDIATGSRRILVGFFKKVVVADNLAPYVDLVFMSAARPNILDSVVGIFGFGLQIYMDFSAYSDIAIGSARLFGFVFPENFNWPYMSQSPRIFWSRWHMTLSRWIRDYLFTPLSFASRRRPRLAPAWLLLTMAVCGLWHGAQWTFVAWGIWHGLLLLSAETRLGAVFLRDKSEKSSLTREIVSWAATFFLVQMGWALFRAPSVTQALDMLVSILTARGGDKPALVKENIVLFVVSAWVVLLGTQLVRTRLEASLPPAWLSRFRAVLTPLMYASMIVAIVIFDQESKTFVYFQF